MNNFTATNDYALLVVDKLRLLMLQSEISSIQHIESRDVVEEFTISDSIHLEAMLKNDKSIFLGLSDDLDLVPKISKNHFVQTSWISAPNLHWCWKEVHLLNGMKILTQPIPPVLCTKHMPINGIVTLTDGSYAFTCSGEKLLEHVLNKDLG